MDASCIQRTTLKRGGHALAVISYNCWLRRFGGDPDIAGKTVKVNGLDFTILGVTPAGIVGTELIFTPEIWVPIAMASRLRDTIGLTSAAMVMDS